MNSIVFHGDQSSTWRGLYFERDGEQVETEEALRAGFLIREADAAAVATLLQNFVNNRDQNHG